MDVLRAVSTAIRCKDYAAVELYLSEGGNPDGFYGMTLLGKSLYSFLFCILNMCHISLSSITSIKNHYCFLIFFFHCYRLYAYDGLLCTLFILPFILNFYHATQLC